jgi:endonuclease/exonuclease/phosphatase family metal-dependent hydrolase
VDGSDGYALLTEPAGMKDASTAADPGDPGYTSRLPRSLFGPANVTERIDYVFVRQNLGAAAAAAIVGGVHAIVIGEEEADKTPSGRWRSDHAGVVATLRVSKALVKP